MRLAIILAIFVLSSASAMAKRRDAWVNDGIRSCMFDEDVSYLKCTEYHKFTNDGWVLMWKARNGREVRYSSRIGAVGIGRFTIGDLFDSKSSLSRHMSHHAVSYALSRNELVIGVPAEGYEFSVKGGGY